MHWYLAVQILCFSKKLYIYHFLQFLHHLNAELIEHYSWLSKIREKYREIFAKGIWKEVFAENGLLIYKRELEEKSLYIYTNLSKSNRSFKKDGKRFKDLSNESIQENGIKISAYSFGIFEEISI